MSMSHTHMYLGRSVTLWSIHWTEWTQLVENVVSVVDCQSSPHTERLHFIMCHQCYKQNVYSWVRCWWNCHDTLTVVADGHKFWASQARKTTLPTPLAFDIPVVGDLIGISTRSLATKNESTVTCLVYCQCCNGHTNTAAWHMQH